MEIGFSTEAFYKWEVSKNEIIDILSSLGTNSIELLYPTTESLFSDRLSNDSIQKLNEFDFISLHAPFLNVKYKQNNENSRILSELNAIAEKVDVKVVVFHPDLVEDFSLLSTSGLPVAIENMDPRKKRGKDVNDLQSIFEEFPKFGMVYDICHLSLVDPTLEEGEKMIEIFKDRIKEIHLSGIGKENESHVLLSESKNGDELLEHSRLLKAPKIIEGVFPSKDKKFIEQEIKFISK